MESAIYYNPSCIYSKEQFVIYIKDEGLYTSDHDDGNFRVFPSFNGEFTEDTLEPFIKSRNLNKVLEMNNGEIIWFNNFEDQKLKILTWVQSLLVSIENIMKFASFNYNTMVRPYTIVNRLYNKLK